MSYLYDAQNLLDVMSEYPEFCSSDPRTETCRIRSAEESGTSSPCDSSHSYPIILTSEHSRSSANKMTHFIKISKFYKHKFDRNESFNLHMIMIYTHISIRYIFAKDAQILILVQWHQMIIWSQNIVIL